MPSCMPHSMHDAVNDSMYFNGTVHTSRARRMAFHTACMTSVNALLDCAVHGHNCHPKVDTFAYTVFLPVVLCCMPLLRTRRWQTKLWCSGESSSGNLMLHMWRSDWRPKCDNCLSSFGFQLQCLHVVITIGFHWIGLHMLNPLSLFGRHIVQLIETFFDIFTLIITKIMTYHLLIVTRRF